MKKLLILFVSGMSLFTGCQRASQPAFHKTSRPQAITHTLPAKQLFIDVHELEPGKVTYEDVAEAHKKDLATQDKYGVQFVKYWVDEAAGKVFCLSKAADSTQIMKTHAEAHGLIPEQVFAVTEGIEAALDGHQKLYFDIHHIGPGKVTAQAVLEAHEKDLAIQDKYSVNFINYWVDEKKGIVMCLAEAPDAASMIQTHKDAHGLVPDQVGEVQQGE